MSIVLSSRVQFRAFSAILAMCAIAYGCVSGWTRANVEKKRKTRESTDIIHRGGGVADQAQLLLSVVGFP